MAGRNKTPVLHWERFEPIAYELNWEVVADLTLDIHDESGTKTQTTIGELLREAMPGRYEGEGKKETPAVVDGAMSSYRLHLPSRVIHVDGLGDNHFPAQMLKHVIALFRMEGETDFRATLFYYDSEWGHYEDSWWERFWFFVVVGDGIVEPALEMSSLCEHDINDSVVKRAWHVAEDWQTPGHDTYLRWWYRRFYTETRSGQYMVLRTDAPRIFHYTPPEHREAANAKQLATISRATSWLAVAATVALGMWALRLLFGGG